MVPFTTLVITFNRKLEETCATEKASLSKIKVIHLSPVHVYYTQKAVLFILRRLALDDFGLYTVRYLHHENPQTLHLFTGYRISTTDPFSEERLSDTEVVGSPTARLIESELAQASSSFDKRTEEVEYAVMRLILAHAPNLKILDLVLTDPS
jgi:hypothetical protein